MGGCVGVWVCGCVGVCVLCFLSEGLGPWGLGVEV